MNLTYTWDWLRRLFTEDDIDFNEWLKQGLIPPKYYVKGIGWFDNYRPDKTTESKSGLERNDK